MNWDAHVGQLVVCISPPMTVYPNGTFGVEVGRIYTIREIMEGRSFRNGDWIFGLLFEEVRNPVGPHGREWCFRPSRFRPVKPTSIECFRHLLAPLNEEVTA